MSKKLRSAKIVQHFSDTDKRSFMKLLSSLPDEEKQVLCSLGIIASSMSETLFRKIFTFSDISWLVIKNRLLSQFWIEVQVVSEKHKLMKFNRSFCEFAYDNLSDEVRDYAEEKYINCYLAFAKLLFEKRYTQDLHELAKLELHNLVLVLRFLSIKERYNEANELKRHITHFTPYSQDLHNIIYGSNKPSSQSSKSQNDKRTGVFYDDESFFVYYKGELISTELNAIEGWRLIERYKSSEVD